MSAGIDFGTANSLIATILPDGTHLLIPDKDYKEKLSTPSTIIFDKNQIQVGTQAEYRFEQNPKLSAIRFFKRSFGSGEILFYDLDGHPWYAESLAALILKKLKADYELKTGAKLETVVLTVPAHFDDVQRNGLIHAAEMVDLKVKSLIDEPIAAAIYYSSIFKIESTKKNILIYDFGAGTFDATVIHLSEQGLYVLSKQGSNQIGGKDLDEVLMTLIQEYLKVHYQFEIEWSAFDLLQLRKVAEKMKLKLSEKDSFFCIENIEVHQQVKSVMLSRAHFNDKIKAMLLETIRISQECIQESGLTKNDISAIYLVGGSSLIPLIRDLLLQEIPVGEEHIYCHQPMNAVALGAALFDSIHENSTVSQLLPPEFRNVSAYYIAIQYFNHEIQKIEYDIMIYKNAPLPAKGVRHYFPQSENQKKIVLNIVQSMDMNANWTQVAQYEIEIPKAYSNHFQIEVAFLLDQNGNLHIKASDTIRNELINKEISLTDEKLKYLLYSNQRIKQFTINEIQSLSNY